MNPKKERAKEEEEEAERLAEWRLGELQKVHVNKNKRKRGNDNDDMGGELDAFNFGAEAGGLGEGAV